MFRNRRLVAFLLLAIGGGIVAYYGQQWYALPEYSDADIEASVELNLALDLQHRGPHLQPTGERLEGLREAVRAEVVGEIRRERRTLERWLAVGLILCALGGANWLTEALRVRASRHASH